MGEDTKIEWASHTFNPWVGCQRVSPGCENCYAEGYDKRVGGGVDPSDGVKKLRWGPKAPRVRTSVSNWKKPLKWNSVAAAAGERHRVFCSSLADVFEDRPELADWRLELFDLIRRTPELDWLLLTKRPENIGRFWVPWSTGKWGTVDVWPNIWLGTTVEDQQRANERIPELLKAPAMVRFLSMEPLLEAVDLDFGPYNGNGLIWKTCPTCNGSMSVPVVGGGKACPTCFGNHQGIVNAGIDWVIIGGESGQKARPFDFAWARDLVALCRAAGARPFVKQLGSNPHGAWGPGEPPTYHLTDITVSPPRDSIELSRRKNGRWMLRDSHGGDPAEWPGDLRVREFPEVRR